jgi:hypothetical protein
VRYHSYFGVRVQRPAEALAAFVPFAVSRLLFVANQPVRPDVRDLDFQLVSLRFHGTVQMTPRFLQFQSVMRRRQSGLQP